MDRWAGITFISFSCLYGKDMGKRKSIEDNRGRKKRPESEPSRKEVEASTSQERQEEPGTSHDGQKEPSSGQDGQRETLALTSEISPPVDEDMTVYMCTNKSSWKDGMTSCFRNGGTPLDYNQLLNISTVQLKGGVRVWTADYAIVYNITNTSYNGLDSTNTDCGYSRVFFFSTSNVSESGEGILTAFKLSNVVQYDNCTNKRGYICTGAHLVLLLPLKEIYLYRKTWEQAKQACLQNNTNLQTHKDSSRFALLYGGQNNLTNTTLWLDIARTTHTLTDESQIQDEHIIKHGTYSVKTGLSLVEDQTELLSSICLFDNSTLIGENFSTDCMQGDDTSDSGHLLPEDTRTMIMTVAVAIFISAIAVLTIALVVAVLCKIRKHTRHRDTSIQRGKFAKNKIVMPDVVHVGNNEETNMAANRTRDASGSCYQPNAYPEQVTAYETQGICGSEIEKALNVTYNPEELYDLAHDFSNGNQRSRTAAARVPGILNVADENVYDNKDSLNASQNPVALHIYDRANYKNGEESFYD